MTTAPKAAIRKVYKPRKIHRKIDETSPGVIRIRYPDDRPKKTR